MDFEEVGYAENIEVSETTETKRLFTAIDGKIKELHGTFSDDHISRLRTVVESNVQAFGTKQSPSRVSYLQPITCELTSDAEIITQPRWLGKKQMEFLRERLNAMLAKGLIRPTYNPHYGSQAFLVHKDGPDKYRMVIDMRKLNQHTRRTSLMMPNLEQQISYPKGASFYGSFDILSGFDYLPVAEESRKYFVLVTCFGAFEFCGSPQGWVNTPQLFQNRMLTEILQPIGLFAKDDTGVIQWIDDSLLYSRTFDDYLIALDKFLKQMIAKNLRLNITKCTLLASEAVWCGRRISNKGWTYSDKYFGKILKTPKPTFTYELAQALYLINWLSPCVPKLAELRDVFSPVVKLQTTMKQLKKDNETIIWTPTLDKGWKDLLDALETSSKKFLSFYDPELPLCLFADASGLYWGLMLSQCTNCDPANKDDVTPVPKQQHRPIFFLSGKFASTQLNWHISQKELYPIIFSFKRLPYMMFGHPRRITVFTDHKNLEHILNPEWSPKTAYIDRLIRWGLMLQNADICVRHVNGDDNFVADILSRWGNQFHDDKSVKITHVFTFKLTDSDRDLLFAGEEISFQNPWYEGLWERITNDDILEAQQAALKNQNLKTLHKVDGKTWIPFTLLPRLVVHNHVAFNHPGLVQELKYLKTFSFELPLEVTLQSLVRGYRSRCLHCHRRPKVLRRALHQTPLTKVPRKILHADYLYINKSTHYLVIVDNATRKVYLKYTSSDDAETMAIALTEFMGNFQLLPDFEVYTDNGSYFAGRLSKHLSKLLGYSRNFSVQFAPWTNGTVEIANSKILKVVKTLCSEFQIYEEDIHKLTGLIMHVMNNSPSPIKASYTPNQLFMDAPVNDPTALIDKNQIFTVEDGEIRHPKNVDNVLKNINSIRELVNSRLEEAYEFTKLRRSKQNALYNLRHNAPTLQHMEGEWVLLSKDGTIAARNKTKPTWVGPYQICRATHRNVYEIRDLLGRKKIAHSSRLWPYAPPHYQPPPNLLKLFLTDVGPLEVDSIIDLKHDKGEYLLLVKWLGFTDIDNSWEPLTSLANDLPIMVGEFLSSLTTKLGKRAYDAYLQIIRS